MPPRYGGRPTTTPVTCVGNMATSMRGRCSNDNLDAGTSNLPHHPFPLSGPPPHSAEQCHLDRGAGPLRTPRPPPRGGLVRRVRLHAELPAARTRVDP